MIFLQTPKFWYEKPNFLVKILLSPISWIYSIISTMNYKREFQYKSQRSCVISIGAITCGGSGKTIATKAICEFLKSKQKTVAILTRGYGRKLNKTVIIDSKTETHFYENTGDEAILLSKVATVYVGKNRAESAKLSEKNHGFDYLILDDGLTQRNLYTDIRIVVIDSEQQFGNGEMLPLGPNRLHLETIKDTINMFLIIGEKNADAIIEKLGEANIFRVNLESSFTDVKESKDILAFCALGFPEKFFNSIKKQFGAKLKKTRTFPDHYPYKDHDIEELIFQAKELKAQLVTTEKDFVKIPEKYRNQIKTISAKINWNEKWLEF